MSDKMDYEEFRSVIKWKLERKFPAWKVVQQSAPGVNGNRKEQLILVTGDGSMLPTMTVRKLYESYLADSMEAAFRVFESVALRKLCMPKADTYQQEKGRLLFAMYHYESNKVYFSDVVYYRWLDLMLVLRLKFSGDGYAGFVKKSRQAAWNVSDEVLYQDAMQNMEFAGFEFTGLGQKLRSLADEGEDIGIRDGEEEVIYVLSNKSNMFGAAVVAIPGLLAQIARKLGTRFLLLLPCSIHMVLVYPVQEKPEPDEASRVREMVREINSDSVQPEFWLSDNVYIYYADMDRVLIL